VLMHMSNNREMCCAGEGGGERQDEGEIITDLWQEESRNETRLPTLQHN
jgi:hypothetical protein